MRVVSRKLPLPTVENCRDLGGIHTEQGRMVRPGLLVRSANLHDARHDDLETLAHRGISNIIDLRTDPERDLKPDRLLEDWSFYALPTFRETKALRLQLRDIVTRPGTFIEDLYPRLVLDDAAVACWKRMFRLLIDEPGSYLFHCTQGKDRTGIAAALILAALEVPEDVIRDDYLQTNLYMSTETPAFVDIFEALLGPKAHADIDEFLVASPLYFQTYIDATASFGGPVGYLRTAIGLSEADLRALRDFYLTDDASN